MAKKKIEKKTETKEVVNEVVTSEIAKTSGQTARRQPKVRGKKYLSVKSKVDKSKFYSLIDAAHLVKETSISKFVGKIEVHATVKTIGDCGEVKLPFFKAKEKKIAIADEKLVEQIKNGIVDFDILISSPKMMSRLLPFAKILGPKGLMPNPKNGTLVDDPEKALAKLNDSSSIKIRTEKKSPLIHLVIGLVNQKEEEIAANIESFIKTVNNTNQISKLYIKATMGPSLKIKL